MHGETFPRPNISVSEPAYGCESRAGKWWMLSSLLPSLRMGTQRDSSLAPRYWSAKGSRESLGVGGEKGSAFEAFLNEENLESRDGRV